jgi:hypothetical protein
MSGVQRYDIPTWECYDLVAGCTIGRLCIIDHGYPLAFPVNFRLSGSGTERRIVVRTGPQTLLAAHEGPVSFEVDEIDQEQRTAWSVIIRGTLRKIGGPHQLPDPEPWISEGRHQWLVVDATAVSGRRFVARTTNDGYSVEWALDVDGG